MPRYIRSHSSLLAPAPVTADFGFRFHLLIPAIRASTSNITAKSCFTRPMPRAAVRNSFVTAVVGQGNVELPPHLQRQQHVLLHHVHVEPCFVRHF